MYPLILSLCILAPGATTDHCEEAKISEYKTMQQCIKAMYREQKKIRQSPFYDFDWMISCEVPEN